VAKRRPTKTPRYFTSTRLLVSANSQIASLDPATGRQVSCTTEPDRLRLLGTGESGVGRDDDVIQLVAL
jgi:hypothetical protein